MDFSEPNLHFIRHAETTFNKGMENFKLQHPHYQNLNFDQLSQFQNFRKNVRYNHAHIDCSITEHGRLECNKAKIALRQLKINPDLILVSPFNRALETCYEIFGQTDIPIIIQPLIGQILKSSCDVSHSIEAKKKKYQQFIFEECQKYGNHWYITKNSNRHQTEFDHILNSDQQLPHEEIRKNVLRLMDEKDTVETQQDLLQRCIRAVQKIKQVYSSEYKEIVLISHFMFMNCVSATKFDQKHIPIDGIKTKNCQIYSTKLSKLFQQNQQN